MGAYSGPHAKWDTMSCMLFTWDFISPQKDFETIEANLQKFLTEPVLDFPNPSSFVSFSERIQIKSRYEYLATKTVTRTFFFSDGTTKMINHDYTANLLTYVDSQASTGNA